MDIRKAEIEKSCLEILDIKIVAKKYDINYFELKRHQYHMINLWLQEVKKNETFKLTNHYDK